MRLSDTERISTCCCTYGDLFIISNTSRDFRACMGQVREEPDESVTITKLVGLALKVKVGDKVRFVGARPNAGAGTAQKP